MILNNFLVQAKQPTVCVSNTSLRFTVNSRHHPDTVARLQHVPCVHSITVCLEAPAQHNPKLSHTFTSSDSSSEANSDSSSSEDDESNTFNKATLCYTKSTPFDRTVLLEATFSISHLCSLRLNVPSGNRLCGLPWEQLSNLHELAVDFKEPVVQGTFGSLPRIPSLRCLNAHVDYCSAPCLKFLTNLTTLHITLADSEKSLEFIL